MNATPLAEIIGINARKLRLQHHATLDDVAKAARAHGLKWTTGRVGDLESGRVAPTLPTLVLITQTLSAVTCRAITLTDLTAHNGHIELTPGITIPADVLNDALRGNPIRMQQQDITDDNGVAEHRLARALGITTEELSKRSHERWGASFSEERDRRAGAHANAQRRGQISRQMKQELQQKA